MLAKKLLQKATKSHHPPPHDGISHLTSADINFRIAIHYGIPSTASLLAFDPIQRLLAIGTLDGRIKVIGGDNIEGVLASPKQLPLKYLEFLQNKGVLISISNDNDIQVWNLENRCIDCSLQWESNITAFSVIHGSCFIYVGDEHGLMSVLKYDVENEKLLQLPYHISASSLTEAAGISFSDQPIVGLLPQPCSSGNRVLIAYESGMIILWDVVESRIITLRGDKVLQLQNAADSLNQGDGSLPDDASEHHVEGKEISALCWASSTGSIVAVGYIDGDILFWKTWTDASGGGHHSRLSNANVVKLQLSYAERRIPVIVLNWCPDKKSHKDGDGKLFIYGGDEIGSEEVLTVLTLEWSPGYETMSCVDRVDLTLAGSFADMTLLPIAGGTGSNNSSALCVLTNPGQIQIFDSASLSALASQHEMKMNVSAVEFPVVIPTVDPLMTVAEVFQLPGDGNSSTGLTKIAVVGKLCSKPTLSMGGQWPLTGGVCNHLAFAEDNRIERVYVAGYQDGSVRIWDATYPILSLLCVFEGEVETVEVADLHASVLKVVFCFDTLSLAVGNERGLVRLYDLNGSLDMASLHFVSETEHRVHDLPQSEGPYCRALFSLQSSPVHALEFANHGAKLIVGYGCGRVAVLDTNALSALFITDCMSNPSSPAISVTWRTISHVQSHDKSPLDPGSNDADYHAELIFVLTKDAKVYVLDSKTGKMVSSQPTQSKESDAISLHVIEGYGTVSGLSNEKHVQQQSKTEPIKDLTASGSVQHEAEHISLLENTPSEQVLNDSLVLLCSKDSLRLYPIKSVVKGGSKSLYKVKLAKPCCWTTALLKAEKICGLVLLFETGAIEIRSLPDLDLVKETSLMSILRWNYKANMARTMSCTDNGHITLANGCEVAFISVLARENDFRIPESLPCLHDKVLAAAADAALNFSTNQKKKQGIGPALLGGIAKGFKGGRSNYVVDLSGSSKSIFSHLEDAFSKQPFTDAVSTTTNEQETLNLDIDDIEIDEPAILASTSAPFQNLHDNERVKHNERDKLLDGGDAKPRLRTREEIIAKYRKAEDVSSVAGQARNKLLERQEKLERISKRTEELQDGAENFASLANELVKAMESRKWWQI